MTLWEFLTTQSDVSAKKVIAIAGVSGLSNAALLAIVNTAANTVYTPGPFTRYYIEFILAITLYIITQRYILRITGAEVERIVNKTRIRLADKIRNSDLLSLESIGRSEIYASVNRETLTISQAAAPLIFAFQGSLLVFFSLLYIFYLSPVAFVLTLLIAGSGLAIHVRRRDALMQQLQRASERENDFFTALTHLIDGFKEVKLSHKRSEGVFNRLSEIAASVSEVKSKTAEESADYYIFSQVIFYVLIGSMVFILPRTTEIDPKKIAAITAAILFIIGPLTIVVGSIPVISAANTAVANIGHLEEALDHAQSIARAKESDVFGLRSEFDTIEFDNIEFAYPHREGERDFKIGPINLTIHRGETLFITGGNGSGKTTFLRVLTGLYHPTAGVIRLDGSTVDAVGYRTYRNLISAIFSDYHLFDRLYGIDADPSEVQTLLARMKLDGKTSFVDGRFLNQELSTGQRKRLALIVTLLERRPMNVFDEWAADQDPTFRAGFYKEILADLKRRGQTIIVATHDDHYFHFADRRFNMDGGQLTEVETRAKDS